MHKKKKKKRDNVITGVLWLMIFPMLFLASILLAVALTNNVKSELKEVNPEVFTEERFDVDDLYNFFDN